DVLPHHSNPSDAMASAVCTIQAFRPDGAPQVTGPVVPMELGMSLKVKLTSLTYGPHIPGPETLRLEATLQTNEMTEATPEGMRVVGQTFRLINHVTPGKPVRLVLARDERGGAVKWVELTVTEVLPPREEEEQIHLGNMPPIPR